MLKLTILTHELTGEFIITQSLNKELLRNCAYLLIKDEIRSMIFKVSDMNEHYIFSEILDLCIKLKLQSIEELQVHIKRILSTETYTENIIIKLQKLIKNTDFSYETIQLDTVVHDDRLMMSMEIL